MRLRESMFTCWAFISKLSQIATASALPLADKILILSENRALDNVPTTIRLRNNTSIGRIAHVDAEPM